MPDMATIPTTRSKPRLNETAWAIIGSAVISMVLATVLVGNPFRALRLAYLDYSHTTAGGAAEASTTRAPESATPPRK
jgi:hypothetical protein